MAGMQVPKYIFTAIFTCYVTIGPSLPAGCTPQMYEKQMEATFWIGTYQSAIFDNGVTSLGYDQKYFDAKLDQALNYSKFFDYDFRHLCHDTMMSTLITLNRSESILMTSYNSSLKDFSSNPELVRYVVNQTAADLSVRGLRIGLLDYSERLELDNEGIWIAQLNKGVLKMIYQAVRQTKMSSSSLNGSSFFSPQQFALVKYNATTWFTKTGQPPKDLSNIEIRTISLPFWLLVVVPMFSILISICQLLLVFIGAFGGYLLKFVYFNQGSNILLLFGCILINLSSIFIVFEDSTISFCSARIVLEIAGFAFANSAVFARTLIVKSLVVMHRRQARPKAKSGSSKRAKKNDVNPAAATTAGTNISTLHPGIIANTTTNSARPAPSAALVMLEIPDKLPAYTKLISWVAIMFIVFINFFVMTISLSRFDPLFVKVTTSAVIFDDSADEYFREQASFCASKNLLQWVGALATFHVLLLLLSCMMAFSIRNAKVPPRFACEFNAVRFAGANAATIFVATILLLFAISSNGSVIAAAIVLSLCQIAYTSTTVLIMVVYPLSSAYKESKIDH